MTLVRIVGLAVCLASIFLGRRIVRAGNRAGYFSIVGGAVLAVAWVVLMVVSPR